MGIPVELLDCLLTEYLRPSAPAAANCFRRVQAVARDKGIAVPTEAALSSALNAATRRLGKVVVAIARTGRLPANACAQRASGRSASAAEATESATPSRRRVPRS